jgi:hypothetical protein
MQLTQRYRTKYATEKGMGSNWDLTQRYETKLGTEQKIWDQICSLA